MGKLKGVTKRAYKVVMNNRRTCNLTGINDVLSFGEKEIILENEQGMSMIRGNELHVSRLTLDKGEVDVDGRIDSFTYSEQWGLNTKGESFLSRLFK